MPKIEIDYSKTIMYKLRHNTDINDIEVYVGHTTNFSKRKTQHKIDCYCISRITYNEKKYQTIRSKGGWEEWEMLPIELYPCSCKIEAEIREEYWRSHYNSQLNMKKAHQTKEEEEEYNKNYHKKYREDNKEEIQQYKKEYRKVNIEKIHKRDKKYTDTHKEEILAQKKEKLTCECGCILARGNISEHRKTKKHFDLMEQKNKNIYIIVE
jgi:hypothetical protein